jgi:hypothetical protein
MESGVRRVSRVGLASGAREGAARCETTREHARAALVGVCDATPGSRVSALAEGRISVLKRRHGLDRCRYHGEEGMQRWVGLGVIANNLVSTATFSKARAAA